ncbi:hypothetical protein [Embleya hyalina]|uniref:Uncharacterized protein n=1 Tax=Embleya hyalina TaxID=516124 RepID=A0A401YE65_9ACTN|nr:hypothetical protein [Embleya hyalina]GCD92885.1 hypothetical protein EHYA_00528 [Embleya hyalina]
MSDSPRIDALRYDDKHGVAPGEEIVFLGEYFEDVDHAVVYDKNQQSLGVLLEAHPQGKDSEVAARRSLDDKLKEQQVYLQLVTADGSRSSNLAGPVRFVNP